MNIPVAAFGGLGLPELLILLVIVVVLFGARNLPELGKGLGEGIKSFKDAMKSGNDTPSQPGSGDKGGGSV